MTAFKQDLHIYTAPMESATMTDLSNRMAAAQAAGVPVSASIRVSPTATGAQFAASWEDEPVPAGE
jgi:hypothetical protein